MLSSKNLLKDGRYRLDHLISAGPKAHLYKAFDNLAKQPIVILKNENDVLSSVDLGIDGSSLVHLHHDGLVRITDHFHEGGSSFTATEPLAGNASPNPRAAEKMFQRLGVILDAIGTLRSEFSPLTGLELSPHTFFVTADNKLKLLSTYPAEVVRPAAPVNSPYLPLEKMWDELDHINQKAIYRTYDESSLAVLESPADARSDLYSLGAVFYRLLTGVEPLSAFERSIDMLDTRIDPLVPPRRLNPEISDEKSAFIVRLLELRRERRFGSIEDASTKLPSSPKQVPLATEPIIDDVDLLEIPALLQKPTAAPIAAPIATAAAGSIAIPKPMVENTAVEVPASKKPLFIELVAEPSPEAAIAETAPRITPDPLPSSPDIFSAEAFQAINDEATDEPKKKTFKVAAMAAAAVTLLAASGWGIFTFNSSKTSAIEPPAAVLVESPRAVEIPAQAASDPAPQPVPISNTEAVSTVAPTITSPESGPSQSKPRPQIAETKPVKPAEKKTNEEKPKKKLTVDDLINDN